MTPGRFWLNLFWIVTVIMAFYLAFKIMDGLTAEVCRIETKIGLIDGTQLNCARSK